MGGERAALLAAIALLATCASAPELSPFEPPPEGLVDTRVAEGQRASVDGILARLDTWMAHPGSQVNASAQALEGAATLARTTDRLEFSGWVAWIMWPRTYVCGNGRLFEWPLDRRLAALGCQLHEDGFDPVLMLDWCWVAVDGPVNPRLRRALLPRLQRWADDDELPQPVRERSARLAASLDQVERWYLQEQTEREERDLLQQARQLRLSNER